MKIYTLLLTLLLVGYVTSQELPSVVSIKVTERSKTSIRVQWEQPEEVSYDRFTVTISPPGTIIEPDSPQTMSRTVIGLSPGRRYTVRIQGFTSDGEGSEPVEYEVNTVPDEPENLLLKAVDEIEISITIMGQKMSFTATVSGMEITWDPVSDPLGVTGYEVTVSPSDGVVLNEPSTDDSIPTKAIFTGLTPGETYTVNVVTKTGPPYAVVNGQPASAQLILPPAVPLSAEAVDITQTTAELKTHLPVTGLADSLYFEMVPSRGVIGKPVPNRIYSMFDMYKLHDLIPGTRYSIDVYGVSKGVRGNKFITVEFTTVPHSPVVRLFDFEETFVKLVWKHPHKFTPEDEISYILQYEDLTTGESKLASVDNLDITKDVEVTVKELIPGTMYQFYITTVINSMKSRKQLSITQATMPLPPVVESFIQVGPEEYEAKFNKSNGLCPKVKVFSSPSFANQKPQFTVVGETITLSGIPANKRYVIQVRCISHDIESRELIFSADEKLFDVMGGFADDPSFDEVPSGRLPCVSIVRAEKDRPERFVKPDACCGGIRPYNTAVMECCGSMGNVIQKAGNRLCCGENHYNKRNEKCCSLGNRIIKITEDCDA